MDLSYSLVSSCYECRVWSTWIGGIAFIAVTNPHQTLTFVVAVLSCRPTCITLRFSLNNWDDFLFSGASRNYWEIFIYLLFLFLFCSDIKFPSWEGKDKVEVAYLWYCWRSSGRFGTMSDTWSSIQAHKKQLDSLRERLQRRRKDTGALGLTLGKDLLFWCDLDTLSLLFVLNEISDPPAPFPNVYIATIVSYI